MSSDVPVFPIRDCASLQYHGMSLRDYFAAKALPIAWDAYDKGYCGTDDASDTSTKLVVELAFQMADAMLSAREKQP